MMASRDDDSIDGGIVDQLIFVGGAIMETELLRSVMRVRSRCGTNARPARLAGCFQRGHQRSGRKDSGAEQANRNTVRGRFQATA